MTTRIVATWMFARSATSRSSPAPSASRCAALGPDCSARPSKRGDRAANAYLTTLASTEDTRSSDSVRQVGYWFPHLMRAEHSQHAFHALTRAEHHAFHAVPGTEIFHHAFHALPLAERHSLGAALLLHHVGHHRTDGPHQLAETALAHLLLHHLQHRRELGHLLRIHQAGDLRPRGGAD